MNQDKSKKELTKRIVILSIIGLLVITFLIVFLDMANVSGVSMETTLHNEDKLILLKHKKPTKGDIIVFDASYCGMNDAYVKRVIATEGQTVEINYTTDTVSVDGAVINETYLSNESRLMEDLNAYDKSFYDVDNEIYRYIVPAGCYFVLGDNRNESQDSRDGALGFVPDNAVKGIVIMRIGSISDMNFI